MERKITKRTKIVATISDLKCDHEFITELYKEGMDVVRLNTAHQDHKATMKVVNNVRSVSDRIALLLDTKGPEIRTTKQGSPIKVSKNDEVLIWDNGFFQQKGNSIEISYKNFSNEVPDNSSILIDDGDIELILKEKRKNYLVCYAASAGEIKQRKSVNVPKAQFNLPSLSAKDRDYIYFAIDNNLDFIAHSFVRNKEDLLEIQTILDERSSAIKIIAKIENQEGVDNIDEILDHAYGVMVARGDLAIEIPFEKIPVVQKYLIKKCIARRKPVIVATQMLHSMIDNPRPTRAEVTDIASAIYSQADATMLSGETAYGSYPVESVRTMATVAKEVEDSKEAYHEAPQIIINNEISSYLAKSAVKASIRLKAKAIVADSSSGRKIRDLAGYRSHAPIFAMCTNKQLEREMALSYGVHARHLTERGNKKELIRQSVNGLLKDDFVKDDDRVVIIGGSFGKGFGATFMEISTVKNLKNY